MDSEKTTNSFVDRLESHLLDDRGDLETIGDELSARIEEARFLGDDHRADILETLSSRIDRGALDDADVLPLIFSLREIADIDGASPDGDGKLDGRESAAEHRETAVSFEMPDNDRKLFSLPPGADTLLGEAERIGSGVFVIKVSIAPDLLGVVQETIESTYSVIHSISHPDGRLQMIVVADQQPQPTSLITAALPEERASFDLKVRTVSFDTVNGSRSVARSWYSRVPAVRLTPQYETIERLRILVNEMERNHFGSPDPVWSELQRTISSTLLIDLKEVFDEMRPTVAALAQDFKKRVTIKIGGDTDQVAGSYADLLRESVFELVCNAVQHGIEPPEERASSGKPEAGTVHVLLRETVDRLVIRVHDDGRGVNRHALKAASSRNSAGGIGRVRTTVSSRFGGKLTLKSGERGTTAEIDVPYGPGVYRAVVFRRHGAYFAAPGTFVIGTPTLTEQSIVVDSAGTPFVRVFGRVLPFLEAKGGTFVTSIDVGPRFGVVLKVDERECVVAADALDGDLHVVPTRNSPGCVGAEGIDQPVTALQLNRLLENVSYRGKTGETGFPLA